MTEAGATHRRVLVVEDELLIALDLGALLGELGYEVVGPVARLSQALALAEAEPLDAAILDVQLRHEERSYAVAERLRARAVPVILCTAHDGDSLEPAYAGFPTLRKPFAKAELAAMLGRLVSPPPPSLAAAAAAARCRRRGCAARRRRDRRTARS